MSATLTEHRKWAGGDWETRLRARADPEKVATLRREGFHPDELVERYGRSVREINYLIAAGEKRLAARPPKPRRVFA